MTEDAVYDRQNFGNSVGFGRRPALLIVDFQVGFADPDVFGGGNVQDAVSATRPLLEGMREIGAPVAYTRAVFDADAEDGGTFAMKVPGLYQLADDAPISQIVPELAPVEGDLVLRKIGPSAFFSTPLMSWLAKTVGRYADRHGCHNIRLRPRERDRQLLLCASHCGRGGLLWRQSD